MAEIDDCREAAEYDLWPLPQPWEPETVVSQRIERLLHQELDKLPEPQQERVVNFARALAWAANRPPGTPISEIMQFAGTIPSEDLREIQAIIERDCEQIDPNGW